MISVFWFVEANIFICLMGRTAGAFYGALTAAEFASFTNFAGWGAVAHICSRLVADDVATVAGAAVFFARTVASGASAFIFFWRSGWVAICCDA